ncbi:MAG: hypothetical protein ACI8QS_000367 [Planctomycetota bacterium]|jgi:hypothetical protein
MNRSHRLLTALILGGVGLALLLSSLIGGDQFDDRHASPSAASPPVVGPEASVELERVGLSSQDPPATSPVKLPADRRAQERLPVPHTPSEMGAFVRIVNAADGKPLPQFKLGVVLFHPDTINANGTLTPSVYGHHYPISSDEGLVDLLPIIRGLGDTKVDSYLFLPQQQSEMEIRQGEIRAGELGATPEEAPDVLVYPRAAAPIRGLVVDEATGQPLTGFALRIQRWLDLQDPAAERISLHQSGGFIRSSDAFYGPIAEWIISDEEGRFVTEKAYPAGRVGFLTIDQQRTDGQHVMTPQGGALETRFEVPLGPIVLLDFAPPGGRSHTDFIAGIWRAPEELLRNGGLGEWPSPWSSDGGARSGTWGNATPVKGAWPAWFRPTLENIKDTPLPTQVFISSRDGRVFGHTLVNDFADYVHQPLHIELEERTCLSGVLVWPEGEPALESAEFTLSGASPVAENEVRFEAQRWASRWELEPETSFYIQFVPAGDYTLHVEVTGAVEQAIAVTLPLASPLRIPLNRDLPIARHRVSGRLETASGESLDGQGGRASLTSLYLYGTAGAPSQPRVALEWRAGVASFQVEDVPSGSYLFQPYWESGAFEISGAERSIQVPVDKNGGTLVFTVADNVPDQVLEIRVIDPQAEGRVSMTIRDDNGTAASTFFSFCRGGDLGQGVTTLPDGRRAAISRKGPYPADARINMSLWMDGHQNPILNEDIFGPPDAEGVRHAEIQPRKGWSVRIHVYEGTNDEGARSLEGIVLAFDGQATAASDSNGFLYATAGEQPRQISVLSPGWELVDRSSWEEWGSVIAADQAFTVEDGRLTVHLRAR